MNSYIIGSLDFGQGSSNHCLLLWALGSHTASPKLQQLTHHLLSPDLSLLALATSLLQCRDMDETHHIVFPHLPWIWGAS